MSFKLTPISAAVIALLVNSEAMASIVRSDIPYQTYRDFGENKGIFTPGATNLPIYDKDGNLVGTLDKAPMVNFSSVSPDGAGTLVAPQYSGSVKHNTGYTTLTFGGTGNNPDYLRHTYRMVDRNNLDRLDYHAPRLHKYVTETAPAEVTDLNHVDFANNVGNRFTALYRTGSGTQLIRDKDAPLNSSGHWETTYLSAPYNYLTGGTVTKLYRWGNPDTVISDNGALYDLPDSPLTSYAGQGDSGSPLFAWDTQTNQWILVGFQIGGMHVMASPGNVFSAWAVYQPKFNADRYAEDTDPNVSNTGDLVWSKNDDNKTSQFQQANGDSWTLHIKDGTADDSYVNAGNVAMNAGKNITFDGVGGEIVLTDDINQGAGGLTFNNNYTVKPQNNESWQGAGVIVNDDHTLTWQVRGVADDFLHKIGSGTMRIEGKGKNLGSLSAGDGTTILAQQADENGEVQAFDTVKLASGRPTVVLTDEKQVNPNKIYFGFRGGRLDVNGNNLTFDRIRNVDNGAQIVNHNKTKSADINVIGDTEVTIHSWNGSNPTGIVGSIYEYPQRNGTVQYFRLKTPRYWYFPNAASNDRWEYLGTDKDKAIETYLTAKNNAMFEGVLGETDTSKVNGELNFSYRAPAEGGIYTLSGGSNLNGEIKVEKGTLLLSGVPTPHANNVVIEDDWISRDFKAKTFTATNGASLQLGNYANLEGNIKAEADSKVSLGYSKGDNGWDNSLQCIRSDSNGIVSCNQTALSETAYTALPYAQVKGDITLADNAKLNLGKTQYQGAIQGASSSSTNLMQDAQWTLSESSKVGNLNMVSGSVVKLNGDTASGNFNQLTIDGDLSGDGRFELNSNFADMLSDRVIVNGLAEGLYLLALQDSGKEPTKNVNLLPLMTLNNSQQDWSKVNATLQNGHVDLGAYRYTLEHQDNSFALYNPLVPENLPDVIDSAINEEEKPTYELDNSVVIDSAINAEEKPTYELDNSVVIDSAIEEEEKPTYELDHSVVIDSAINEEEKPTYELDNSVVIDSAINEEEKPTYELDNNTQTDEPTVPNTDVSQKDWISQRANTAISDHSSRTNLLTKQQTLLNQYLNNLDLDNGGVWINGDRERINYGNNDYRNYQQDLYTQQIGADTAVGFSGGNWLLGGAFTHIKAKNAFAENQNSETTDRATSIYSKVIFDNQLYVSAALSHHQLKTELGTINADIKQRAWTTAIGSGKRWEWHGVGVQPSLDLIHYRLSSSHYQLDQADVQIPTTNFLQARGGIRLDKAFDSEQGNGVKLYTALYYTQNMNRNQNIYVNNHALNATLFKNRVESEVGAVFGLGQHVNLTIKGGYAQGDVIDSQFNGGLELKYIW